MPTDVTEHPDAVTLTGAMLSPERAGSAGACPMEQTLGVVGTRSAMVLIREAFYGGRRFDDLARRAGITESVAAKRLRELVGHGIFERAPYREKGQRTRHEYVLTERGRALFPILAALVRWGDTYSPPERGALKLIHSGCGADLEARVVCTEGHEVGVAETSAVALTHEAQAER